MGTIRARPVLPDPDLPRSFLDRLDFRGLDAVFLRPESGLGGARGIRVGPPEGR
jgi:hypothetical protein